MSRAEILERESRWRLPVAAIGALGLVLLVVGNLLTPTAGETAAEGARTISEDPAGIILSSTVTGLGLVAILGPLLYVFSAARARSESVFRGAVGFVVLGPLLFGAAYILSGFAATQVADDFVAAEAAAPEVTEDGFLEKLKKDPAAFEEVTHYTESDEQALDVETSEGIFYSVEFEESGEKALTDELQKAEDDPKTSFSFTEDEQADPGAALLQDIQQDSKLQEVLTYLASGAQLLFVIGLFYTSLHAMRTGLYTRFYGTLMMALSVGLILIPQLLVIAFMVFLGGVILLTLGRFPGGTPPAWAAGVAMPWPKPGEEEAQGAADVLEGDASEVDPDSGDDENPNAARRHRAKRKKRKRR